MISERMFLTFTSLADASRHREYNEWHQLDHLPENFALPGVAWGDRWVRTPDCAEVSYVPDPRHRQHQYAVMYWFRPPVTDSIAAWTALNQRAIWWGRRPELGWTRRSPLGFFAVIKAEASRRVLISPEAVRCRPHAGVHLSVCRLPGGEDPATVAAMAELDRHTIPAVLEVPGVVGVSTYRTAAGGAPPGGSVGDPTVVVRLVHLDADPVACTELLDQRVPEWTHGSPRLEGVEEVLFSSPLRSIAPGSWNWFD